MKHIRHFPTLIRSVTHVWVISFMAAISTAQIPQPTDAPGPLSPEESAQAFKLPEEFRMEVIASEPLIAAPSGLCWDERGRMFVCELHGYNLEGQLDIEELNRTGKLDTRVRRVQAAEKFKMAARTGTYGVVKLLRDTDGDGRMDRSDVWTTNLPPAYGLVPANGGVIVACAPDIVFLADRDGDGHAEVQEVLFTGFRTGALERGINSPQWGADGWIYFARGWGGGTITGPKLARPVTLTRSDFRIRPDGSAIEPVTGNTHTFGFAMTESGDRFTVTTTVPGIYVAPLPWRYLLRNPDAAATGLESATGDRRVYPLAPAHPWRRRRAEDPAYFKYYRDRYGASDSDATGWFTSACGALIYRDFALPGLRGQYFVCDPSGNLIHRALVEPDGSTLNLHRVPGEEQSEFAATRDPWSHPISLTHGPDGAIWIVDYYREIIEDYSAIPRHLQQQYGLYAGHDRGRIYRLTHRDAPLPSDANMSRLDAKSLVGEIASPTFWRRQTAKRLIEERRDTGSAPALRELLTDTNTKSSALITALRTLDGLGVLLPHDVQPFIGHAAPSVRVHALQLSERWLETERERRLLDTMLSVAAIEQNPRVLIQFALSLGESKDRLAFAQLVRFARERTDVRWMDTALMSSLSGRGADMLLKLLREPANTSPMLDPLAQSIGARRNENELADALKLLDMANPQATAAVLGGLANGRKNAPRKPLADKSARASLAKLAANPVANVRRAARTLEETFLPAPIDDETHVPTGTLPMTVAVSDVTFRKFVAAIPKSRDAQRGHQIFLQACAPCHRINEEGHEVGPDLLGQLAMGSESLVRDMLIPGERIRPGFETTLVKTHEGNGILGILKDDGATSLSLSTPNGVEQVLLRKDVAGVRRLAGSLMPSFAEALTPKDVANLLHWLRGNLRVPDPNRISLFDEEPGFAAQLNEGGGVAKIISQKAFSGKLCLSITPPQRFSARIAGWNYQIVEKPSAPGEFRYLRLVWRASGDGVMVELARSGAWPRAEDANGRYFAGHNTTKWQARKFDDRVPGSWSEATFDLWRDMGSFTLTGMAPTAMGGEAWFDRIELLHRP